MTRCAQIQRMIWTSSSDDAVDRHAAECEDCGLELRRAQMLGRQLSGLADLPARATAPLNLLEELVTVALGQSLVTKLRTSRTFWGGVGVSAAAAATTVGVLIARKRLSATREAASAA